MHECTNQRWKLARQGGCEDCFASKVHHAVKQPSCDQIHFRALSRPGEDAGWETDGVGRALFLGLFRPSYPHSDMPTGGTQTATSNPRESCGLRPSLDSPQCLRRGLVAHSWPYAEYGISHAPGFDLLAVALLAPPEHLLLPRLLTAIDDHQVARLGTATIHVARHSPPSVPLMPKSLFYKILARSHSRDRSKTSGCLILLNAPLGVCWLKG